MERVERHLAEEYRVGPERTEGVVNWGTFVGEGAPRFSLGYSPEQSAPNYAILLVNVTSYAEARRMIPRLEAFCSESGKGIPMGNASNPTTRIATPCRSQSG